MKYFKARAAWVRQNWMAPFYCQVDDKGAITQSSTQPFPDDRPPDVELDSILLPGFINAHSHAFQFSMAGLTEKINPAVPEENFWTWREAMYHLALNLDHEDIRSMTAGTYMALIREGYTHVCEFHYLHNDRDGKPYQPQTNVAQQIVLAANDAGIGLTLIPVYYRNGSFDQAASRQQRRFIFNGLDSYMDYLNQLRPICEKANVVLGHGAHSLRAVPRSELAAVMNTKNTKGPIHIHISEQQKEVSDCLAKWKARPIEYLMNNIDVNNRFTLVHATHVTAAELAQISNSSATVAICPTTEANLGDGLFATKAYLDRNGSWSIGSDSHIGLSPVEELRWLDYQVRLSELKRNPLATINQIDSARLLYESARRGGARSAGLAAIPELLPGASFTAIALNCQHLSFIGKNYDEILSTYLYSGDKTCLSHVFVDGVSVVTNGKHLREKAITSEYCRTLQKLQR